VTAEKPGSHLTEVVAAREQPIGRDVLTFSA
jgi:hypothetical protein